MGAKKMMMVISLSTRFSEHVMHAQMKDAQKRKNHQNQPVVNQLVVNQLVTSQLEKNHQQENARTLPLCLVKILFSLLPVLKMMPVKWLVMFNAQTDNSSWVKMARPVHQLFASAKGQNANLPIPRRRPSTVK